MNYYVIMFVVETVGTLTNSVGSTCSNPETFMASLQFGMCKLHISLLI
jgi:hypothetical protein